MKAQVLSPSIENIKIAAEALKQGDVVAIPTETVYGLAGNVFNPNAVTKIFETKERPTFDPLIAHVAWPVSLSDLSSKGLVDLTKLSPNKTAQIEKLIQTFWPGPLTLVLPKQKKVPDIVTSGLESVAVRSPNHPIAQLLLKEVSTPLAAPSANRFGRISPTSAQDVFEELGDRIRYIVDGGRCEIGLESTIVHCSEHSWTLLRPGKISQEEIEHIIGEKLSQNLHSNEGRSAAAPGMLASHYAPRTSLTLFSFSDFDTLENMAAQSRNKCALLLFSKSARDFKTLDLKRFQTIYELSSNWSLEEAAQNLFSSLRTLDQSLDAQSDQIFCEEPPPESQNSGLGFAIIDRLKRASHKR